MSSAPSTLFVSDLHLDESRPAIVARFERFVEKVVPGAAALYVLGDLFESWVGDDTLDLPFQARVARMLKAAAAHAPVSFMHGNRDFLAAERFSRESGATLLADPTVIDLHGRRAVLLHGDTLCTDDRAYQAFRRQVRDPAWQKAALVQPLAARLALARQMREKSEGAKGGKSMEIMDVSAATVEQVFRDTGADLMIHGHTHRPAHHVHQVDGRERHRWVLPDWYERGGYLAASAAGVEAVGDF